MEFCFEIMPADRPDLKDQLARSLDLQTELRSRQKLPRLWKKTDQLNSKVSDDVVKRRKTKNKVFGIFFMIVGSGWSRRPQRPSGGRRHRPVRRHHLSLPKVQ